LGRLEVELRVSGSGDAISALGKVAPGTFERKGDPIAGSLLMRHKEGGWSVASMAKPDESLEKHILSIRSQVADHHVAITQAASVREPELSIALYVGNAAPVVDLSIASIAWLASIRAKVDIDAYGWEPD
jgi:Domain of unknown function (DUF4279)